MSRFVCNKKHQQSTNIGFIIQDASVQIQGNGSGYQSQLVKIDLIIYLLQAVMGCRSFIAKEGSSTNQKSGYQSSSIITISNPLLDDSIFKSLPNAQEIVYELLKKILQDCQKKDQNPQSKKKEQNIEYKKIFTASSNHFKASSFHQQCDNKSNTLVIALTTSNKIFGGFTPCTWHKDQHYKYCKGDQQGSSFLFRLNQSAIPIQFFKIKQKQKEKAIMNHEENGPIFGQGHDLYIADQCDRRDSWNNIGKTYHSAFPFGTRKSNQLLSGQQRHRIKEYQVWEIIM